MTKSEAEELIRSEVHQWASETGFDHTSGETRFWHFKSWLLDRWPDALNFRSTERPEEAAEYWFGKELKQMWRN